MKILIIEDDRVLLETYFEVLFDCGHQTRTASSMRELRNQLISDEFDLVFADLNIPGANQFEVVREIGLSSQSTNSNIIVLTNMGSGIDKEELYKLGVKEVHLKIDVTPRKLIEIVQKYT